MSTQPIPDHWQQESEAILSGVAEWRQQHPRATWREIEQTIDERLGRLRSQLLQDTAQQSQQRTWSQHDGAQRPQCPPCHVALQARGSHARTLHSSAGSQITLQRSYGTCPQCGGGFFPLDEELGVASRGLTPHAHECLVRLCAWMPFAHAAELLQAMLGVQVSQATARRLCLQAGQAVDQIQQEQARPQSSARFPLPQEEPAERLVMSCDGALVPLRHGQWAEAKMLVIGQVDPPDSSSEQSASAHSSVHSYFARLMDATTFADAASVEIKRRGLERAKQVAAVQDGAEWLQSFVDGHRHDAVRILDFAHAAGYVAAVAEQAQQAGIHLPGRWLDVLLHHLKHVGPERGLAHLQWLADRFPLPAIAEAVRYFSKRLPQMQSPQFQADGWPIGSGLVESAHKVVMQARLKGAGMHWEESNVNPMLALRCAISSDRWDETWQQQERYQRDARELRRQQRVAERRAARRQRLGLLILRLWLFRPSQRPQPAGSTPKGRTESQKRWGRRPFSWRTLHEGHSAKK